MELDDGAHGVVEHEEAAGLLLLLDGFVGVDEVVERGEDLVHPLDIFDSGVEFGVDEEDSAHDVVAVGDSLHLLAFHELLVLLLVLPVHQPELLLPCPC